MMSLTVNQGGRFYEVFRYPAGETQVRFDPYTLKMITESDEIRIVTRIRNAEDVVELVMLSDAIAGVDGAVKPTVIMPYLPYSRADRRFCPGDCYGLQMFGKLLSSLAIKGVVTLDVHSNTAYECIPNLTAVSAEHLVTHAILSFAGAMRSNRVCVLFPDAGARERYSVGRTIGSNTEVVHVNVVNATKTRDQLTGKFSDFSIPAELPIDGSPILIIDDICDGGGTFLGIGDRIDAHVPMGLYVTHGIFSKGVSILRQRFSWIGSTNSFSDEPPSDLNSVFDVIPMLLGDRLANHLRREEADHG